MTAYIILALIALWLIYMVATVNRCPECRMYTLDSTKHGYGLKYSHCTNCGYCTFCNKHKPWEGWR